MIGSAAGSQSEAGAARLEPALAAVAVASAALMVAAAAAGMPLLVTSGAAAFAVAAIAVSVAGTVARGREGTRLQLPSGAPTGPPAAWLRQDAHRTVIAYLWGAAAMQGVYLTPVTGLRWQHGWQYALAIGMLALGALAFARWLAAGRYARPGAGGLQEPARGAVRKSEARAVADPVPGPAAVPSPMAAPVAEPMSSSARAPVSAAALGLARMLAAAQALVAIGGLAALAATGKLGSVRADWAANRVFAGLAIAIAAITISSLIATRRAAAARPG